MKQKASVRIEDQISSTGKGNDAGQISPGMKKPLEKEGRSVAEIHERSGPMIAVAAMAFSTATNEPGRTEQALAAFGRQGPGSY